MSKDNNKTLVNKKAYHDYKIADTFEAGIVLTGDEIKAIRAKGVNILGSYAKIISGEVFWLGGNFNIPDGTRTKKLLLHKDEIKKLIGKLEEKGYSLVPLKLYLKRGKAKLELGLGKGLKKSDKREIIKKKDQQREAERGVKSY